MTRYAVSPEESRIWAEARSSLHDIRLQTAGPRGFIDAEVAPGEVRLLPGARIELAVELLRSGNTILDGELRRRLDARRHPDITGELRAARPLSTSRWLLEGDLTLHGVRKATDVEVELGTPPGRLEVRGEKVIDMREFGVDPPKLLFLRVDPRVRIRVHLVATESPQVTSASRASLSVP